MIGPYLVGMLLPSLLWLPILAASSPEASLPLHAWKPAHPRMAWNGPTAHEPKESELMTALMAFDPTRSRDSAAVSWFFRDLPGGTGWQDSARIFGDWILAEKRRLKEQVFHVDFYHDWPAYDARRGGFPLDVFRTGSCGYYDNFRGITSDGAWSFDFGRHIRARGSPTRFLLPMEPGRAREILARADGRGRLLLRVHFRYAGKVARSCEPGGAPLPWNIVEVLRYEVYPPPGAWKEPPDPGRRLAAFPGR